MHLIHWTIRTPCHVCLFCTSHVSADILHIPHSHVTLLHSRRAPAVWKGGQGRRTFRVPME